MTRSMQVQLSKSLSSRDGRLAFIHFEAVGQKCRYIFRKVRGPKNSWSQFVGAKLEYHCL